MNLPVINTPTFPFYSYTLKNDIEYRAFNLGEEKVLSTIINSDDNKEIAINVRKVVQNCVTTPDINVGKLAAFDVELLLLKIRGKAAGEEIKIEAKHPKTEEKETLVVNLDEVHVTEQEGHDYKIPINDDVMLLMKDLTFDEQLEIQSTEEKASGETAFDAMMKCVKGLYDKSTDKSYIVGENTTQEEMENFLLNLSGMMKKISDFFRTTPTLKYETEFSDGEKLVITNFKDFLV